MNFLLIAIIGYALLAVVAVLDKFILTNSVRNSGTYLFYSTIFFFAVFVLYPFVSPISSIDIVWAVISGLAFGLGLWASFNALKYGEASHIGPFIGALVAVFTFILSSQFLGEVLTQNQQLGMALLIIASFIFSYEKTRKHSGFHKGFAWGIFAGLLFAISHVTAKYFYDIYPFITSIMWTKGTAGLVGIFALFLPGVVKEITAKHPKTKNGMSIIISDKVLGIIGVIFIQYAIALGSVTIVNSLAGIQFALAVLFIYLLTKLKPKLFSEYFAPGELRLEILAIILIIFGMIFLN